MLPMGTIMASCMALAVLFSQRLLIRLVPQRLRQTVGIVVVTAGAWNVLWYSLQHLDEFWGLAALVSGVLMLITGIALINQEFLPASIQKAHGLLLLVLGGCALLYAYTIYTL